MSHAIPSKRSEASTRTPLAERTLLTVKAAKTAHWIAQLPPFGEVIHLVLPHPRLKP